MSVFSDHLNGADAVIFSFFGTACTYTPLGGGGASITAVIDKGEQTVPAGPGEVVERMDIAHIRTAQLSASPGRGDILTDGTNTWVVERVAGRDEDNLMISLELLRT